MRIFRVFIYLLIFLAALYAIFLGAERMTTQELTRADLPGTGQAACVMWSPRLLRGDGVCSLRIVDSREKMLDAQILGVQSSGFEALQHYGLVGYEDGVVRVWNRQTGAVTGQFALRDGCLLPVPH